MFQFLLNHQPISKQSSLKYLGIVLDDTQLEASNCKVQIKHYANISMLKSVYFAIFHSYLLNT